MKDVYLKNKETGELVPSNDVFKMFYSIERSWRESPFDEWDETNIEVENSHFDAPDFTKVVNI